MNPFIQELTENTLRVFREISIFPFIQEYTLIGGTALALQIHHRKSEDLDFCIWSKNLKKDKPTIDWPLIEKELASIGKITTRDVLGFDQVNFNVDKVRISFIAKQLNLTPVKQRIPLINNICAADIGAIGAMKIELILRRSEFKDYYDIYSTIQEGRSLKEMIWDASKYSNHLLRTRDALSFLSNGNNYKQGKNFKLLEPVYDIDHKGIEEFIRSVIKKEFGIIR
jgi:hypothetical protein